MTTNLQNLMPSSTNHIRDYHTEIPSNSSHSHSKKIVHDIDKNMNGNNHIHQNGDKSAPSQRISTYRSPINRKRGRTINDNYCSSSPNINNSLKRQRRKLSPKPKIQQIQSQQIQSTLPSLVSLSPEPKLHQIDQKQIHQKPIQRAITNPIQKQIETPTPTTTPKPISTSISTPISIPISIEKLIPIQQSIQKPIQKPKKPQPSPCKSPCKSPPKSISKPPSKAPSKSPSKSPSKASCKSNTKRTSQKHPKQRNSKRNTTKNSKKTKSRPKKRISVEDWSETDENYSDDDDYIPSKHEKQTLKRNGSNLSNNSNGSNVNNVRPRLSRKSNSKSCGSGSSSDCNLSDTSSNNKESTPSGYRKLHWRKKQVATPKFIVINDINQCSLSSQPPVLMASASTVDMYGIEGDKLEDTSNEAYFYRHYRAEAREKLFYEELFESRLKQQQILEEKEKRRKKKQKRKQKRSKKKKSDISDDDNNNNNNNIENINDENSDNEDNDDEDDIDLTLPTLPKGPWSFKLGSEYDKRPKVPSIVTKRPQFNYYIPFEKLQKKQFVKDENERKKLENWWKMPSHLIRRTDYGMMGNITIPINTNGTNTRNTAITTTTTTSTTTAPTTNTNTNRNTKEISKEEKERKKKELIELYQQLKREKSKKIAIKKEEKKKKHKKKHKHKKNKKIGCGPIDVRLLLSQKHKKRK